MMESDDDTPTPPVTPASSPLVSSSPKHSPDSHGKVSCLSSSLSSERSESTPLKKSRKMRWTCEAPGGKVPRSTVRRWLLQEEESDDKVATAGGNRNQDVQQVELNPGANMKDDGDDAVSSCSQSSSVIIDELNPADTDTLSSVSSSYLNHSHLPSDVQNWSSSDECTQTEEEEVDYTSDCDESFESGDLVAPFSDSPLYEGAPKSVGEAIVIIMNLYVCNHWTKDSLKKALAAFQSLLPDPNGLPPSVHLLFKQVEDFAPLSAEQSFVYCSNCFTLRSRQNDETGENNETSEIPETCKKCEGSDTSKFYHFPLSAQIKYLFEERGLANIVDAYQSARESRNKDEISDVLDGEEYSKVAAKLTGRYDLVLIWNTDGVSMSNSSNQQLWPILSVICQVPPHLRSSFLLVNAVWCDSKKPVMNDFLKPFVDSIKSINESGGVKWVHPVTKETLSSLVAAPTLCADAPAKSECLNMQYHSAKYGCPICEQKAVKVIQENGNGRNKALRRFVFTNNEAILRSEARINRHGIKAEREGTPVKGVKGNSCVADMPFFDRGKSICAEYLHVLLLGVVKYFCLLWFFDNSGPWYIGNKINAIDKFMTSIKVPDYVHRLPQKVSCIKQWKASEFRSFLLFFSLPAIECHMPAEFVQHWILLAGASYILLKKSISKADLTFAEDMMKQFMSDVHKLYGDKYYTYNVHQLLHLTLLVKRWGPLWSTSAFCFESFNGSLIRMIHGTKHKAAELVKNIRLSQGYVAMANSVNSKNEGKQKVIEAAEIVCLGNPPSNLKFSDEQKKAISQFKVSDSVFYLRARKGAEYFTSAPYDARMKQANSYVRVVDNNGEAKYGQIQYFLKRGQLVFVLLEVLKVKHNKMFFHEKQTVTLQHIIPFEFSTDFIVIPSAQLDCKLIRAGLYLCSTPNDYEQNL